ncbi:MAG: hypothetical protein ABID32_04580 [Candidatus Omnitrophota bacterium]
MRNKILISVFIGLLIIGSFIVFRHYSSVKYSLLVDKELKEELQKLKEAGIPTNIEELNLPAIPDAENGALVYKEIFELKDSLESKYKEIIERSPNRSVTGWKEVPEEKKQEVIDFILNNPEFAELHEMLEKASGMECRFSTNEDCSEGISYDTKVGSRLRSCARDLADKARIEREHGDVNKSLNASLIGLKLPKCLANEPLIIYQLVRFAMDGIALRELEETINKGEGDLELYQSLIDEIEKERTSNIINLTLKRDLVCHTLPFFSEYEKRGEEIFELTGEQKKRIEESYNPELSMRMAKEQKQALKNAYLNSGSGTPKEFFIKEEIFSLKTKSKVIPLTEKPYWQAYEGLGKIDEDIKNLQDKNLLSNIISSSNQRMYMSEALCDARLGIAEIAIANKIYNKKYGEYVGILSQLIPEILPSLPLDPFSGKDYVYKKKDKGFIVYSVGDNMKDDNGTKRTYEKNSPAYENYDIVWEIDN